MRREKAQHTASAYVTCVFCLPEPEVVQARVEIAPGVTFGRHRHPGDEIVYVLEGSLEYQRVLQKESVRTPPNERR